MRAPFVLLACLYLTQGLGFGFFTQALPVVLRQEGVALQWIGLSSLLAVPWALKWIWAPWVDRHGSARLGHYRSWLLAAQLANVVLMLTLAVLATDHTRLWLMAGCLLSNAIAATQDVATDGLAVRLLDGQRRGYGNAIQVGAYRLGMILGGGALLIVLERSGLPWTLLSLALISALCCLPVLGYREPPRVVLRAAEPTRWRGFFARPGALGWILLLGVYKSADAFATGMLRPYLVDQGFGLAEIGVLVGTVGSGCALAGAVLGGGCVARWGTRRTLVVFAWASSFSVALYAALASGWVGEPRQGVFWLWATLVGLEHWVSAMGSVALFSAMMDACRVDHEGTDYSLQASWVVVCSGLASVASGGSAAVLGHTAHFALGALACAAVALAVQRVRPPAHFAP